MRSYSRILAFLLLLLLILPFAGVRLWLETARMDAREAAEATIYNGIPKEALVVFTFTPDQVQALSWEHDREFEFRGQMYDVVDQQRFGDSIRFFCFWDKEETLVKQEIRQLARVLWNQHPAQVHGKSQMLEFAKSLITPPDSLLIIRTTAESGDNAPDNTPAFRKCPLPAPPVPPPEIFHAHTA